MIERCPLYYSLTLKRSNRINRMNVDTLIQFDDILPIFTDNSIDFMGTGSRFCSIKHFYMLMNNSDLLFTLFSK